MQKLFSYEFSLRNPWAKASQHFRVLVGQLDQGLFLLRLWVFNPHWSRFAYPQRRPRWTP